MQSKQLTDHGSLLMNQYSEVFENLINFTDLLLDFLYSLFSFLYNSLIESDLIIQQQDLLPAT